MPVLVPISIFALLLSFMASYNSKSHGLEFCFIVVTVIQAIHYKTGSDYMVYYYRFQDILYDNYLFSELIEEGAFRNNEYGWAFLCWIFGKIFGRNGFFFLVAVLSIIQNGIYYFFIKSHVERRWWFFSVFIYLFTPSFYLYGYSGLRQWFVIALAIFVFMLLEKRRFLLAIIIVLLGSTIHKSGIVLLLSIAMAILPFKKGWSIGIIYLLLLLLLFVVPDIIEATVVNVFRDETFEGYSGYAYENRRVTFGVGFLLKTIPFFASCLYLIFNNFSNRKELLLVAIACIGTLILPFASRVPLVTRVSHYFAILTIASLPIVYKWIKSTSIRTLCLSIFVFMTLLGYVSFFTKGVFVESYRDYQTIFSVL